MGAFDAISALRIGLASPEQIRRWSYGEVTRPETLNYRTQKPEKDGLFCERIFGPTRDWSCACGKYRRKRRPGMVCNKCGVELTIATVRRERMGHIELAAPIVHPWYRRTICLLVDLSPWQLSALLGYQRYLVLDVDEEERGQGWYRPKDATERTWHEQLLAMKPGDLLEEGQYRTLSILYPGVFHAKTGAEAIRLRLNAIDLDDLAAHLHDEIDT